MRSAASSGCSYKDVERLAARVGSLDRHFGQAQKDIDEIRISADRARSRARRLEAIDFARSRRSRTPSRPTSRGCPTAADMI